MIKLKVLPTFVFQKYGSSHDCLNITNNLVKSYVLPEVAIQGNIEVLDHWFQHLFEAINSNNHSMDNPDNILKYVLPVTYHEIITTAS